jgi:GNAT superfamily N-acetyltransferase
MNIALTVRDMTAADELFVGTCSHVNENSERTGAGRQRVTWLKEQYPKGFRAKVATLNDAPVGFLYVMPANLAPWGPIGLDTCVIQCLGVVDSAKGNGVGRALVASAEEEARNQDMNSLSVLAFYHDSFFMQAPFFEKCGFKVAERSGTSAILWKPFDSSARPPTFPPSPSFTFKPMKHMVVVDLFWSMSCPTTQIEAQRVRDVVNEFSGRVVLREHCSDHPAVRRACNTFREIYINGKKVGWGYEAPKDGLREAIQQAIKEAGSA